MSNPLQTNGLVWSNNKGMLLIDGIVVPLKDKPIFNFNFHSIYYEPTLCKRVLNDKDYELSKEEIAEIQEFIAIEKTKPQIVNGVDANGKYMEQVPSTSVVRVVQSTPPNNDKMWRLNETTLYEQWDEVFPVDRNGYLMDHKGLTNDSQAYAIIKVSPPYNNPEMKLVRIWKWDFNSSQWTDGETYENKIKVLQERRVEEFKEIRRGMTGNLEVEYNKKTYDGNVKSLTILTQAYALGYTYINWYPKNELEPVRLEREDIKALAMTIFNHHQLLYNEYFTNKSAVLSTLDETTIQQFNPIVSQNGPTTENKP